MSEVIRLENLTKTYRKRALSQPVEALKNVSFSIRSGRKVGFIGANGAGKTTTLRCLLGFTRVTSGGFYFFGEPGLSLPSRKRIGYLPEQPHFYPFLTGYEFLKFYLRLSGLPPSKEKCMEALKEVNLQEASFRPLSQYSKGMLQRIGLAQSLIHQPELLILDEPMSGLDPDGRRLVKNILQNVASQGVTLFFSTHLLDDVEDLCDDVILMDRGKVSYEGCLDRILDSTQDGYEIVYRDHLNSIRSLSGKGSDFLNRSLFSLVSERSEILDVKKQKKKLDEAFRNWMGKDSST